MIHFKSTHFTAKAFNAGDIVAEEGKNLNSFYIVIDGSVGIYRNYKKSTEKRVKVLGDKVFFGDKKANETAVAEQNSFVLVLELTNVYKFFLYEPEISASIFKSLFGKVRDLYAPLVKQTTKEVVSQVSGSKSYETNPELFFSTGGDFYNLNINKPNESYFKTYNAQSVIVPEGEKVDNIYIMVKGSTGIYRSRKKIAEIQPGNFVSSANFLDGVATEVFAANKDTEMIVLTRENTGLFFKNEPKAALEVLKLLCNRIELLNNFVEVLKYGKQILPMNHPKYDIKIETDPKFLEEKFFTCPVCQNSFKSPFVNTTRMLSAKSDDDSRMYYDGVEPLFYDVITCTKCWYTALKDNFEKGMATLRFFEKSMEPYKSMNYNLDKLTYNIDDVLLAYYFADFCIEECFNTGRSMLHAKIALRLSWLYNICGDEEMEKTYVKKAREFFMAAFGESAPDESRQAMGLMIVMGVVCFKVGDKKNAKFFLSNVVLKSGIDEYKEKARGLLKKYEL